MNLEIRVRTLSQFTLKQPVPAILIFHHLIGDDSGTGAGDYRDAAGQKRRCADDKQKHQALEHWNSPPWSLFCVP